MKYKCAIHIHSNYSYDSRLTLPEIKKHMRQKGYHALFLAEHTKTMKESIWNQYIEKCNALSDKHLLIIPGLEIETNKRIEILGLGLNKFILPNNDTVKSIEEIKLQEGISLLSHPRLYHSKTIDELTPYLDGVEVWNIKHDGMCSPNLKIISYLKKKKPPPKAFAGLDLHTFTNFPEMYLDVFVSTNNKSRIESRDLISALKSGDFVVKSTCMGRKVVIPDFYSISFVNLLFFYHYRLLRNMAHSFYSLTKKFLEVGLTSKTRYIIRIDDFSQRMDYENFLRLEALLDKHHVKAIVAVVPKQVDKDFNKFQRVDEKEYAKKLNELTNKGWKIALHGYNHTDWGKKGKSIVPVHEESEFTGRLYREQYQDLKNGKETLEETAGIEIDTFIAPYHTFDSTTLKALKAVNIYKLSDGWTIYPFYIDEVLFIPQQICEPIWYPFGVHTICLHPQTMTPSLYKKLDLFIEHNRHSIYGFDSVVKWYQNLSSTKKNIYQYLNFLYRTYKSYIHF